MALFWLARAEQWEEGRGEREFADALGFGGAAKMFAEAGARGTLLIEDLETGNREEWKAGAVEIAFAHYIGGAP